MIKITHYQILHMFWVERYTLDWTDGGFECRPDCPHMRVLILSPMSPSLLFLFRVLSTVQICCIISHSVPTSSVCCRNPPSLSWCGGEEMQSLQLTFLLDLLLTKSESKKVWKCHSNVNLLTIKTKNYSKLKFRHCLASLWLTWNSAEIIWLKQNVRQGVLYYKL